MTAETSIVSGIAGRYATALFELAADANALESVAADLADLAALLDESADLRRLVLSPMFKRADQAKAMAAVLGQAGAGDLVRRFVAVVAENRRLFALPQVIDAFNRLLARHRGEMVAEVASATPLTPAQTEALQQALRQVAGTDVKLDAKVDEALVGGLVVKLGSRMVDSSVRTKLQNLRLAMRGIA